MCHDLSGAKTVVAIGDADNKTILGFYSLRPPGFRPGIWEWIEYYKGKGWAAVPSCGPLKLDAPHTLMLPLAAIEAALQ